MSHEPSTKDIPVTLEKIGFSPEQMCPCERCEKPNPPSRPACLYCGAALRVSDVTDLRISRRRLEEWERGYNVIVLPTAGCNIDSAADDLAKTVAAEGDELRRLLSTDTPLPISRVATDAEAQAVVAVLRRNGFESCVLADADLISEKSPVRLRGLEFGEGFLDLLAFNTAAIIRLEPAEIVLLITGTVFESRVEKKEKRKRSANKILDEHEMVSDEPVLDIYSRVDNAGWRIATTGFDYSCLEAEKSILATENIKRLAARLQDFAPEAKFIDKYVSVRPLLDQSWQDERRSDGSGLQRSGFGRKTIETTVSTTNLFQFNRYSRMHRQLL